MLAREKKFLTATEILGHEEFAKLKQVALLEGSIEDFRQFWSVENVLLDGLEALDRFDDGLAELNRLAGALSELKRGREFDDLCKAERERVEARAARLTAKKAVAGALAAGSLDGARDAFKAVVKAQPDLVPWAAARIAKAEIAAKLLEALLKDPEIPDAAKTLLKPADEKK
jgi:hypothetical protein